MTAHRPHGLVLIGGNGETWGEASRDKFRKNSPRKGTNISTGGFGFLDGVPTAAV